MKLNTLNRIGILLPLFGIILFVILYIIATLYYPGGSNSSTSSKGFDLLNNYWCDLTGEYAKNGELNSARPIAITAMIILCFTVAAFWLLIPQLFKESKINMIIQIAGVASAIVLIFLFTDYHDIVINIAGTLGIVSFLGTFMGLYKNKFVKLLCHGIFCLMLMLINYFIYQTGIMLSFLPVIQKVTFVLFLFWVCLLDVCLYKERYSV